MAEDQPVGQEEDKGRGSRKKWQVGGVMREVETVLQKLLWMQP